MVGLESGVTDVTLSYSGTGCAVVNAAGSVRRYNGSGNIGDGTVSRGSLVPVQATGLDSGVSLVSLNTSTSAAVQNGALRLWGDNGGKWGLGRVKTDSPVPVPGGDPSQAGASDVAVGWRSLCFLAGGAVFCGGTGTHGQTGPASPGSGVFAQVTGLPGPATNVAAGRDRACAIVNGGVWCWGSGTGDEVSSKDPRAVVGLDSGVTDLVAQADHLCALKAGLAFCWGANASGQLGDGKSVAGFGASSSVPVAVTGLVGVTAIAGGRAHTCAVARGGVWCWGSNAHQQLGNASIGSTSSVPVLVDGAPTAALPRTSQTVNARRLATLGTVTCPRLYPCTITAPRRATVRIAGRAFPVSIQVKRSIGAGRTETLRASLTAAAAEALKGRTTKLTFRFSVLVSGQKTDFTLDRTLRAR